MTIAHLFNKVYLSFDTLFQPAFDTLVVSGNHYAPHESFMNKHITMGDHFGRFEKSEDVNWTTFFAQVKDRRTIVYADPENFATIYFSFLKTINPKISKTNATKILEIVLKRAEFCFVEYDIFVGGLDADTKSQLKVGINTARECYDQAWTDSKAFALDSTFVQESMGIEFLIAKYWATGRGDAVVKNRLEQMWWKAFVNWGEEYTKWYTIDWMYNNPNSTQQLMFAKLLESTDTAWMADPNLSTSTVEEFKYGKTWSVIDKIYKQILSSPDNGIVIELEKQWDFIVNKDWDVILNKENPLALLAVGTEPTYRVLINNWLISYFAAQSQKTLGDMVV